MSSSFPEDFILPQGKRQAKKATALRSRQKNKIVKTTIEYFVYIEYIKKRNKENKKMQITKSQHYVPRNYLRSWARDGYIAMNHNGKIINRIA